MPATAGGGLHAIIGTIEQVGLALLISLPLGAMAAIFLNESRSKLRRPVRIFVDAMSGMPSIVSGLFIYATLIIPLAKQNSLFGFNGFMASLALSMTMMPTICRADRGGPPPGAGRAQGGRTGPRSLAGEGRGLCRPAHRVDWGGDRRHSRDCPGGGRDGAAAVHGFRLQPLQLQPVQRRPGEPAALHLPLRPHPVGSGHPAGLCRRAGLVGADPQPLRRGSHHRAGSLGRQSASAPRVRPARQPSLLLSTAPRRLPKPAQTLRSMRPALALRSMRPAQGKP